MTLARQQETSQDQLVQMGLPVFSEYKLTKVWILLTGSEHLILPFYVHMCTVASRLNSQTLFTADGFTCRSRNSPDVSSNINDVAILLQVQHNIQKFNKIISRT